MGPHSAWLKVDGSTFLIETGSVTQSAMRKTAGFHVTLPLSEPGAYQTLPNIGGKSATIEVTTRGVTKTLITGEVDEVAYDLVGRKIVVKGRDVSAKLHDMKSSDKWANKKTTEIVEELAGRAGLG